MKITDPKSTACVAPKEPLIQVPFIDPRITEADMTRATVIARSKYPYLASQFKGPLTASLDAQTGAKTFTFEGTGTGVGFERVETGTDSKRGNMFSPHSTVTTSFVKVPVNQRWTRTVSVTLRDKAEPVVAESFMRTATGVAGSPIAGVQTTVY